VSTRNKLAQKPPMGWNSYDCYIVSVTEAEVKAQADFMAEKLAKYGYEYVTIDAGWYFVRHPDPKTKDPGDVLLDGWGRQLPVEAKYPSAANGQGFKPLADYIHGKGLKLGIHLMRGIPRKAVDLNLPVLGTNVRASHIADKSSTCPWSADMYGVDMRKEGAQAYYDSVFRQFAWWGMDFVKCDDINWPYYSAEIEAVSKAIERSGRTMLLSLSPGDKAEVKNAEHVKQHAELWRISGDVWDKWEQVVRQFERCRWWQQHIAPGAWPDADMLPLGHISVRSPYGEPRYSRLNRDEQQALLTLWYIFRSPLMIGSDLPTIDDYALSLLTNEEALAVDQNSTNNHELFVQGDKTAWCADDPATGGKYVAIFNLNDTTPQVVEVPFKQLGLKGKWAARDLWDREDMGVFEDKIGIEVCPHGADLIRLTPA
jgi:alpha-galactosidase